MGEVGNEEADAAADKGRKASFYNDQHRRADIDGDIVDLGAFIEKYLANPDGGNLSVGAGGGWSLGGESGRRLTILDEKGLDSTTRESE